MSTVKSKSTKAVAVAPKALATTEHPIEKEAIKKTPGKPSPAKKPRLPTFNRLLSPLNMTLSPPLKSVTR